MYNYSYDSLAREAEEYYIKQELLNERFLRKMEIVDDKGDTIEYGEWYADTPKGLFSKRSIEKIAKEGNFNYFIETIFGNETMDWAEEWFECEDYIGIMFETEYYIKNI